MRSSSVAGMTLLASLDATVASCEEEFLAREAEDLLDDQFDRLDHRHRTALIMRYGLNGGEPATYSTIGYMLGVTSNRASLICREAEEELRQVIVSDRFEVRAGHVAVHADRQATNLRGLGAPEWYVGPVPVSTGRLTRFTGIDSA